MQVAEGGRAGGRDYCVHINISCFIHMVSLKWMVCGHRGSNAEVKRRDLAGVRCAPGNSGGTCAFFTAL